MSTTDPCVPPTVRTQAEVNWSYQIQAGAGMSDWRYSEPWDGLAPHPGSHAWFHTDNPLIKVKNIASGMWDQDGGLGEKAPPPCQGTLIITSFMR